MLSGLLASARELRNPLTVGYSVLVSLWLVVGEALNAAARQDPLGRRLLGALDAAGDGTQLALLTFTAAIVGSVFWNLAVARLVQFIATTSRHPDWSSFIEEAKDAVRSYEQYRVVTEKGRHGNAPSPFDAEHTVASPRWASYLHERVEERERKAAEMSFRVTLALTLIPIAIALGIEGGGLWWWSILAVPFIWLDVLLMKYTTLRTVRRYELEDLQPKLESAKTALASEERSNREQNQIAGQSMEVSKYVKQLRAEIDELEARQQRLIAEESRRMSRIFAFLEGKSVA